MLFTPEQLRIIEDALELSCQSLGEVFEQHKYAQDVNRTQKAVEAYGKLRRFNKLLSEIKEAVPSITPNRKNNVLLMIANRK